MNAGAARPPLLLDKDHIDGTRDERLRAEGEVEDAGRLVREHEAHGDERVDAAEGHALDEPGDDVHVTSSGSRRAAALWKAGGLLAPIKGGTVSPAFNGL